MWGSRLPNHANRVTNTATSAVSNAANTRMSGSVQANHGRSHSPYCGEDTLLESRNTTRRGNPNVHAGKSGCRDAFNLHTSTDPPAKTRRDARPIVSTCVQYGLPVIDRPPTHQKPPEQGRRG